VVVIQQQAVVVEVQVEQALRQIIQLVAMVVRQEIPQ
jgi:hypothetical protein